MPAQLLKATVLVCVCLAGPGMRAQAISGRRGDRPPTSVPKVVGLTLPAGAKELERAKLRWVTAGASMDRGIPEAAMALKITGQKPEAQARVQEGTQVVLETNLPRSVTVPNLVGLTVPEAAQLLKRSFLLGSAGDLGRKEARILRQSRPAGSTCPPFETVSYYTQPPLVRLK